MYVCMYLSIYLSIFLSMYLSIYLSGAANEARFWNQYIILIKNKPYLYLFKPKLSFFNLNLDNLFFSSMYLSIYLFIYVSTYISIYLSGAANEARFWGAGSPGKKKKRSRHNPGIIS